MTRTNDHRIRILAVYTMLKNTSADKPITAKKILGELDKQYHIKAALTTIYVDVDAIRLFANIRSQSGKGFWIEQGNAPTIKGGDKFYYVYFSDDKKRYKIDRHVAEEVSDKRVWTDNVLESRARLLSLYNASFDVPPCKLLSAAAIIGVNIQLGNSLEIMDKLQKRSDKNA